MYLLIHHHPLKLLFFCVHSVVGWEVYFVCKESSPRAVRGQCVWGGSKVNLEGERKGVLVRLPYQNIRTEVLSLVLPMTNKFYPSTSPSATMSWEMERYLSVPKNSDREIIRFLDKWLTYSLKRQIFSSAGGCGHFLPWCSRRRFLPSAGTLEHLSNYTIS